MGAGRKGKRLNKYVADYVVFDLETTGFHPERDAIIEISAIRVCGGEIAEEYSTLVNPHCHIPAAATRVNGITDSMVRDAPDIREAIGGFMDFAGDSILVGHNIHTFDMNFACNAAWEALNKGLDNDYIDTLYMARNCLPQLSHYKLTDISAYFHISTEGAHRALNDCLMNQKCYEELGKIWEEKRKKEAENRKKETENKEQGKEEAEKREKGKKGTEGKETDTEMECPRCGGMLYLRKGRFGAFYGCGNFPSCRYTRNA